MVMPGPPAKRQPDGSFHLDSSPGLSAWEAYGASGRLIICTTPALGIALDRELPGVGRGLLHPYSLIAEATVKFIFVTLKWGRPLDGWRFSLEAKYGSLTLYCYTQQ